jgi:hypothetical protein
MANGTGKLHEFRTVGLGILRYGIGVELRYVEDNPGSYVATNYDRFTGGES